MCSVCTSQNNDQSVIQKVIRGSKHQCTHNKCILRLQEDECTSPGLLCSHNGEGASPHTILTKKAEVGDFQHLLHFIKKIFCILQQSKHRNFKASDVYVEVNRNIAVFLLEFSLAIDLKVKRSTLWIPDIVKN